MSFTLYKSEIDYGLKEAKAQLSSIGFYDRLRYKSLDGNGILRLEASVAFHSVEMFSSLIFSLTKKLKQYTEMDKQDINDYSLYIASKETALFATKIADIINLNKSYKNQQNLESMNLESIVNSKVKTDKMWLITRNIISELCDCLRANNTVEWPYIIANHFLRISEEVGIPKNCVDICVFDRCYNNNGVKDNLLKPPKVKVVGNRNVLNKIRCSVNALLRYLPDYRYNPGFELPIPFTLNIYGKPGVGKTLTIHQISYEALQKARHIGLELHIEFLGNQLKNEYINYGSRLLSKIFDQVSIGDSIWLLVMDEAHRVLFSQHTGAHEEEVKFSERIITFLEGVQYPNHGNYVFVLLSNYAVTNTKYFDSALASRFLGGIVEAKGPETLNDYKQLFIEHLKGFEALLKKGFDYNLLAKIAFENKVSGRAVNRACKNLVENLDLRPPNKVFKSKKEALQDVSNMLSKTKITTSDLVRALEEVSDYERAIAK